MAQRPRCVKQHVALVIGHRQAERHDQRPALQLIVEQCPSGNRHPHPGDGRFDRQVIAIEGMPASHIRPLEADGIEVKLPFRVLVAAAPGGDVVQQGKVHQVCRTVQRRTTTQQARRAHRENLFIQQGCG
ncbi:hypothetical protein D3C81_1503510 [compost metagenome]